MDYPCVERGGIYLLLFIVTPPPVSPLFPPTPPFLLLALLFIFLLELSDSYVQHKEAVLLAGDAAHVRK